MAIVRGIVMVIVMGNVRGNILPYPLTLTRTLTLRERRGDPAARGSMKLVN